MAADCADYVDFKDKRGLIHIFMVLIRDCFLIREISVIRGQYDVPKNLKVFDHRITKRE